MRDMPNLRNAANEQRKSNLRVVPAMQQSSQYGEAPYELQVWKIT